MKTMYKLFCWILLSGFAIGAQAQAPFITTWKTDNPGETEDNQILLSVSGNYSYNYDVYWEEVGNPANNGTSTGNIGWFLGEFPHPGIYRVEVTGYFPAIMMDNQFTLDDREKLLTVEQWGDNNWESFYNAFSGCTNLTIEATDTPDLSNVESLGLAFQNCININEGFENWDVSNVIDLGGLFNGATNFNGDITQWDVSNVGGTGSMFQNTQFNQDISQWDVSNVANMSYMFANTPFNQDISQWNTGNVQWMIRTFQYATDFNQDISQWDVSNVISMNGTFWNASSFNQNLSSWDVSNVTNMSLLLSQSGISMCNYDATLEGWAQLDLQEDITLNVTSTASYENGEAPRQHIMDTYNWFINDQGLTSIIGHENVSTLNCPDSETGQILINFNNNQSDFTIEWTGESSGSENINVSLYTISNLTAGDYSVNIYENVTGCHVLQKDYTLTSNDPIEITDIEINPVSCAGENDGSIHIQTEGGIGSHHFDWYYEETSLPWTSGNVYSGAAGNYNVIVKDQYNCEFAADFVIPEPDPIVVTSETLVNNTCFNSNEGSIAITAEGGTGDLIFEWTNNNGFDETGNQINNLEAETYTVTISDENGCEISETYTISEPSQITISSEETSDATCNNGNDGVISILANGGTGNLTFEWTGDNGFTASGSEISNFEAGTYALTISDENGCEITDSYDIAEPTQIILTSETSSDVSCFSENNGAISILAEGGTGNLTYNWTDNDGFTASGNEIENLEAGTYLLTIFDENNCEVSESYTITQPNQITIQSESVSNISCSGEVDGSISTLAEGGTGNLTYSWTDNDEFTASGNNINNLQAGTYVVTILDENGCEISESYTISEPVQLNIISETTTDATCFGGNDGTASVTADGGTGDLTFEWTDNNGFTASGSNIDNLEAGTYMVTVSDENGCETSESYTISEPVQLNITSETTTDATCFGGNDGTASVTADGGAGDLTFEWTDNDGFTASGNEVNNLQAGTYVVTISDENGCETSETYTISEPAQIIIESELISDISCNGEVDGSISNLAEGGTGNLTYNWTDNDGFTASGNEVNNLQAGTYIVTISDENGCEISETYTISEPAQIIIESELISVVSCFGETNGSISLEANGGTGELSFDWSNNDGFSETGSSISDLTAGNYDLTITDENGCEVSNSYTIEEPEELSIEGEVDEDAITVSVSGGEGTLTIDWTGPNDFSDDQLNIVVTENGEYTVTVTDENGCSTSETFTVSTVSIQSFGMSQFKVYPNPAHHEVNFNVENNTNLTIQLFDMTGKLVYSAQANQSITTVGVEHLNKGMYIYRITNSKGEILKTDKLSVIR